MSSHSFAWSVVCGAKENRVIKMAARTPRGEKHACLSPQGFHAAIFSLRFTYILARQTSETGTTYSLSSGWLDSRLGVDRLTFEGGDFKKIS